MRVCRILWGFAAALFFLPVAQAQKQIAIYGEATMGNLQFPNTSHLLGGTFGIYETKTVGPVAIGGDLRGGLLKRGSSVGSYNDQALDMGQLGVRVSASPHVLPLSLMPYAEGLIGLGYWRGGIGVTRQDKTHALMQVVAGVDVRVYKQLEWRIAEFSYGRAGAQPGRIHPETFSTGIVIVLR
jgi:hypothetical protein